MPTQANSLESVIKFLGTKAHSYADVTYEPSFKSSAIFPLWCGPELSLTIAFMNYWKHKNKIQPVSCLLTVRDRLGRPLHRTYTQITEETYRFRFPELAAAHADAQGRFVGSCEVEFHAVQDLKFPYPAVSIFYEAADGVGAVHMAGRVFHSTQDMDQRAMPDVQETGFDLHATKEWMPFFCYTNGPRALPQAGCTVRVFNHRGEERRIERPRAALQAYETVFVFLDEDGSLQPFLDGRPGFCKVGYDSFGIFPRLLCGNIRRDRSLVCATHSYYDVTPRREYFPMDPAGATRSPFRAIPLLFHEGVDLDLNFYPIYCPSELGLRAAVFDVDGRQLAEVRDAGRIVSPGNRMVSLDVRALIARAGVAPEKASLLSIEGWSKDGKVSSRINFGVNYHRPGQLGTNINISMHQDAEFQAGKTTSYRWLPAFRRRDLATYLLVAALSPRRQEEWTARVQLAVFNAAGPVWSDTVLVRNRSSAALRLEDLLGERLGSSAEGEVLWCTLEADRPAVTAYFLTVSGAGHVGGDHSY